MAELALADDTQYTANAEEQLVTMTVDGQLFGIPILRVQDIVEPTQITPVPLAPSAIAGVLNLRGRIVTVIDLRECLGAPEVETQDRPMSVTVEHKGDLYTLLVDSIGDVRSLPRKDFDKPPATLDERVRRLCSGIYRLADDLLVLLDVDRILAEDTLNNTPSRTRRRRKQIATAPQKAKAEKSAEASEPPDAEPEEKTEASKAAKPAKKPQAGSDPKSAAGHADTKPAAKKVTITAKPKEKAEAASKPEAKPASTAKKASPAAATATPSPSSSGTADMLKDEKGRLQLAERAADLFFEAVSEDQTLKQFYASDDPGSLAGKVAAVFRAAFDPAAKPNLKAAYEELITHDKLTEDDLIANAAAIHGILTELDIPFDAADKVMQVVDTARIRFLDS